MWAGVLGHASGGSPGGLGPWGEALTRGLEGHRWVVLGPCVQLEIGEAFQGAVIWHRHLPQHQQGLHHVLLAGEASTVPAVLHQEAVQDHVHGPPLPFCCGEGAGLKPYPPARRVISELPCRPRAVRPSRGKSRPGSSLPPCSALLQSGIPHTSFLGSTCHPRYITS